MGTVALVDVAMVVDDVSSVAAGNLAVVVVLVLDTVCRCCVCC